VNGSLYTFTLRTYPKGFNNIVDFLDNLTLINKSGNTILLANVANVTV
jgi:hypothetical protein